MSTLNAVYGVSNCLPQVYIMQTQVNTWIFTVFQQVLIMFQQCVKLIETKEKIKYNFLKILKWEEIKCTWNHTRVYQQLFLS